MGSRGDERGERNITFCYWNALNNAKADVRIVDNCVNSDKSRPSLQLIMHACTIPIDNASTCSCTQPATQAVDYHTQPCKPNTTQQLPNNTKGSYCHYVKKVLATCLCI